MRIVCYLGDFFSFSHFTIDVFILVKKGNDWILKEGLEFDS